MCRYAFHAYKPHYVCFNCRKMFKQPLLEDMIIQNGDWDNYQRAFLEKNSAKKQHYINENPDVVQYIEERYLNKAYKCPECAQNMLPIGMDVRVPKKDDKKAWKILESMYKLGNTFHSCGCYGSGYIPKDTKNYSTYLQQIENQYKLRLADRSRAFSEKDLSEYIRYWETKLQLVQQEINNLSNNNSQ